MEKAIESFVKYQSEADEKFNKLEEDRWKKEMELEEKRQREECEHEIRLFQMLGQMIKPTESYPTTYSSPNYNFDYEY